MVLADMTSPKNGNIHVIGTEILYKINVYVLFDQRVASVAAGPLEALVIRALWFHAPTFPTEYSVSSEACVSLAVRVSAFD